MNKNKLATFRFLMTTVILFLILLALIIYLIISNSDSKVLINSVKSIDYKDNTFYVVGNTNDNDNYVEKAKFSIYDNKFNKTKEKLYNKSYASSYNDFYLDKNTYVFVGNISESKNSHKKNINKSVIIKYDDEDNIIFEKTYSLYDNNSFTNISKLDEDYLVVGYSNDDKKGSSIIIRYDSKGKVIWKSNFGDNIYSRFNSAIVLDNYIYAVGLSNKNIGVICKYDFDGNLVSYKEYKFTDDLGFSDIVSYKNNIYVVGGFKLTDTTTINSALIIKYDLSLNIVNEEKIENNYDNRYNSIIVDNNNYLIVIGNSKEDDYNGLISKYDTNLNRIATVSYGDEKNDYFNDIVLYDNNYLVVGYSSDKHKYQTKFITYSDALKVLEAK